MNSSAGLESADHPTEISFEFSPEDLQPIFPPLNQLPLDADWIGGIAESTANEYSNAGQSPFVQSAIFPNAPILRPEAYMDYPQFDVHGAPGMLDEMATPDEGDEGQRDCTFPPLYQGRSATTFEDVISQSPRRSVGGALLFKRASTNTRITKTGNKMEDRRLLRRGDATPLSRLIGRRGVPEDQVRVGQGLDTGLKAAVEAITKLRLLTLRTVRSDDGRGEEEMEERPEGRQSSGWDQIRSP
ncbi:hypothetical protein CC86DRAFT_407218 [Ophiobolus disseminans]|uniref:Uncharacterized protein n=1 Tax=Ophiobolus disseminans TaxID=1469910 RepID=A0A6A6ZZW4_9PLEO|nr:hypothetical protein CC86DRAFT_407218 [Ophiobolus disseminans]